MKKEQEKKMQLEHQISQIQCHYHPQENLKYFCKKPNCIQPLCKLCLDIHIDEHEIQGDTKDVALYQKCLSEVQKKMAEQENLFSQEIAIFIEKIERVINFQCDQNLISLIEQAEHQTMGIVQSYFSNLRSFLFSQCPQMQKLYSAQESVNYFQMRCSQLKQEVASLYSEKSVQQLIFFYQGDVDRVTNHYKSQLKEIMKEIDYIKTSEIKLPKLKIDPQKITDLLNLLCEYVSFENDTEITEEERLFSEQELAEPQQQNLEEENLEISEQYNSDSNI